MTRMSQDHEEGRRETMDAWRPLGYLKSLLRQNEEWLQNLRGGGRLELRD